MSNLVEKPIRELLEKHFFIPSYQRGYRWTVQQVTDLLNDIWEFIHKESSGFYCIQPLVVKKGLSPDDQQEVKNKLLKVETSDDILKETENILSDYTKWEVIDGQQRLTTIFILLRVLGCAKDKIYSIGYETRAKSQYALNDLNFEEDNIDFYHMQKAKETIEQWFDNKGNDKKVFKDTLLNRVKFIWYEIDKEDDPIKVFTRLNIGKIALTNAELIKALFLNKSNFEQSRYDKIRLQQQEIASEWDSIEYVLQNDEFWLFLNEDGYDKPTRIDFIFDLICTQNNLNINEEDLQELGNDKYKTFRYFYKWFDNQKEENQQVDIVKGWKTVKTYFQIFKEWFNDLELYHYIGYLITLKKILVSELVEKWNNEKDKEEFFNLLTENIKTQFLNFDINQEYETENSNTHKTVCKPILLLHNVQTVINQNKELVNNEKYKLPVFYKFPFHLFKKESWDVEHIDSNTENLLEKEKDQKEWLKFSYFVVDDNLKEKIKDYLTKKEEERIISFQDLHSDIIENTSSKEEKLNYEEKNQLWNFCLLDASTNRSYGNAIFPAKRRILIGKEQGKTFIINDNQEWEIDKNKSTIAFVLPCTKNVFLKYYNPNTNNLREWTKADATSYKNNIQEVLKEFLPQNTQENEQ